LRRAGEARSAVDQFFDRELHKILGASRKKLSGSDLSGADGVVGQARPR
jgi:hypothetical protein